MEGQRADCRSKLRGLSVPGQLVPDVCLRFSKEKLQDSAGPLGW